MKTPVLLLLTILFCSCSIQRLQQAHQLQKKAEFEQFDCDGLSKLYMRKSEVDEKKIEGIYSVSHLIVKKSKPFLSGTEREKVMDRKENYSNVAIFREGGTAARDYFEIPVSSNPQFSYSVRGEFSCASEGSILIYRHFELKKKVLTYTFTYDADKNILEGVRTENDGSAMVTYTLTYVKLYPKGNELVSPAK
ncbi:MAG: hypothetical protein ACKO13_08645 [Cytophagales bacterium]